MSKRIRRTIVAAAVMGLLTAGLGAGAKWSIPVHASVAKPDGAKWAMVAQPNGAKWN